MKSSLLVSAPAAQPVAAYVGGKRNLAKRIIERIGATPHRTYAEVFVGMGGIFLRRPFKASAEVINDRSRDVHNLFRVLQVHYVAFLDMLRYQLTTRAEFERLMAVDPVTLTDMQRAARFLYLQRTAFGGKVEGRNFGVSRGRPASFDVTKLQPLLEAVHERLAGVVIEDLDFEAFLARYDREDVLFYLDPPYFGSEDYYGAELFSRADFERLANALARVKGRFMMSINDTPEIRQIFGAFSQEAVATTYTLQSAGAAAAGELIITGRAGG